MWNSITEVVQMTGPGGPGDGTPSIESLRELQLRALLNDLVHDLGPVRAAERLGVDRKTLWRSEGAGQMTPRLVEALERMLLERALAAMEEDRAKVRVLEERVAGLEGQLQEVLDSVGEGNDGSDVDGGVVDALRGEWAEDLGRLERRVDRLESARGGGRDPGGGSRSERAGAPHRNPDLVVREPAEDDEEVYGAAWPLVEEWRCLWDRHSPTGRGLAWASRRERILELELALLEEHGLTLPPETAPLAGPDRREQLSWRERELAAVSGRRRRLELLRWARRVLTLGLWRDLGWNRAGNVGRKVKRPPRGRQIHNRP